MESSNLSFEVQFRQQVEQLCEGNKKSVLLTKLEYYKLIDEVKEALQSAVKSKRQYYILKRFVF